MAAGAKCCGMPPFSFHRKLSGLERNARGNKIKNSSKNQQKANSTMFRDTSRVTKSSIKMNDLRSKIRTLRYLLHISPCLGSTSVKELLVSTLRELHKSFPHIRPNLPISELKAASLCQVLNCFCGFLKSMGDSWTDNAKWRAKYKNDVFYKLDQNDMEKLAVSLLGDINKLAKQRMFNDMDDEELKDSSPFEKAMSESFSEGSKTPLSTSPRTPTSVLPIVKYEPSRKLSYTPSLLPLRLQAVEKLNPVDLKHLTCHMLAHVVPQNPTYLIKRNEIQKVEQFDDDSKDEVRVLTSNNDEDCLAFEMEEDTLDMQLVASSQSKTNSRKHCSTGTDVMPGDVPYSLGVGDFDVVPPPAKLPRLRSIAKELSTAVPEQSSNVFQSQFSSPSSPSEEPTFFAKTTSKASALSTFHPPPMLSTTLEVTQHLPWLQKISSQLDVPQYIEARTPSATEPPTLSEHLVMNPPPSPPPSLPPIISSCRLSFSPPSPPPLMTPGGKAAPPPPPPPPKISSKPTIQPHCVTSGTMAIPPPPPPPSLPSGAVVTPPPPPLMTPGGKAAPPPPPPPPKISSNRSMFPPPPPPIPPNCVTSGTMAIPPPPPPSLPSGAVVTPPPPPPPPMGARNAAPPPPPPPARGCNGGVAAPPPLPMRMGGAPPPPPPGLGGAKNLHPKNNWTKLKRSAQMGNLYRLLRGKVEGSSLEGKSTRKGKIGAASAGGKQGMADALAEMTKRSAYFQQIEEDVKNHATDIKELKVAINSFETSDMAELLKFHKYVESYLEKLTDETQVLARFEDFPSKKLEALRMSAALFSKLDNIATTLKNWQVQPPFSQQLANIEKYFDKIKGDLDALERTKDEEAKKFKSHKIQFDFSILVRIKELMVDLSSSCMELALKERRDTKTTENKENGSKMEGKKKISAKVLWRAFQFAYRVYTFAGGQDDRADILTKELAHEIEVDPQN